MLMGATLYLDCGGDYTIRDNFQNSENFIIKNIIVSVHKLYITKKCGKKVLKFLQCKLLSQIIHKLGLLF